MAIDPIWLHGTAATSIITAAIVVVRKVDRLVNIAKDFPSHTHVRDGSCPCSIVYPKGYGHADIDGPMSHLKAHAAAAGGDDR